MITNLYSLYIFFCLFYQINFFFLVFINDFSLLKIQIFIYFIISSLLLVFESSQLFLQGSDIFSIFKKYFHFIVFNFKFEPSVFSLIFKYFHIYFICFSKKEFFFNIEFHFLKILLTQILAFRSVSTYVIYFICQIIVQFEMIFSLQIRKIRIINLLSSSFNLFL